MRYREGQVPAETMSQVPLTDDFVALTVGSRCTERVLTT
jgi:hypothetical protein